MRMCVFVFVFTIIIANTHLNWNALCVTLVQIDCIYINTDVLVCSYQRQSPMHSHLLQHENTYAHTAHIRVAFVVFVAIGGAAAAVFFFLILFCSVHIHSVHHFMLNSI